MLEQKNLARRAAPVTVAVSMRRQERELMALATQQRWPFQVLGVAPVPEAPVRCNDWWLVPAAQDHSQIPARALERVQAIYQAGIRPLAFVIAHESPRELPTPAGAPKVSRAEFWSHQVAQHSASAAKVAGGVLAAVIIPLTVAAAGIAAVAMLGVVTAASAITVVDPCLIVVTEDNVWIQIDWWAA